METIKCKALVAFTHHVPGFGQVHGDPDNKKAKTPDVPVNAVAWLVEHGRIEEPKNFVDPVAGNTEVVATMNGQAPFDGEAPTS